MGAEAGEALAYAQACTPDARRCASHQRSENSFHVWEEGHADFVNCVFLSSSDPLSPQDGAAFLLSPSSSAGLLGASLESSRCRNRPPAPDIWENSLFLLTGLGRRAQPHFSALWALVLEGPLSYAKLLGSLT